MKKKRIIRLCLCALFSAFIAVCSWFCILLPSGVPLTLQIFAVALSGYFLGALSGPFSVLAYILIGAVGLPVFSAFTSGFGVLTGATGGFIWGFIFLSLFCGLSERTKSTFFKFLFSSLGIIICHLLGIAQYCYIASISPFSAFLISSAPYIIKDVIFVFGAFILNLRLKKVLNLKN